MMLNAPRDSLALEQGLTPSTHRPMYLKRIAVIVLIAVALVVLIDELTRTRTVIEDRNPSIGAARTERGVASKDVTEEVHAKLAEMRARLADDLTHRRSEILGGANRLIAAKKYDEAVTLVAPYLKLGDPGVLSVYNSAVIGQKRAKLRSIPKEQHNERASLLAEILKLAPGDAAATQALKREQRAIAEVSKLSDASYADSMGQMAQAAINTQGKDCPRVTAMKPLGTISDGTPLAAVACSNGTRHVLTIQPNMTFHYLSTCAALESVTGAKCF